MRLRHLLCVVPLLVGLSCGTSRGVWVRVAETTCHGIVELLGEDDTRTALCLVAVDLVRLLAELRAAESSGRGTTVHAVTGDGEPITVEVPARHVPAAVLSVRAAMGSK